MSIAKLNEKLARQEERAKQYEKERANSIQGKIYRLKMKVTRHQLDLHPIELRLNEQRRKKAKLDPTDKADEARINKEITKLNKEISTLRERAKTSKKPKVVKKEYVQSPAPKANLVSAKKRKWVPPKQVKSYKRKGHMVKAHHRAGGVVQAYRRKGHMVKLP